MYVSACTRITNEWTMSVPMCRTEETTKKNCTLNCTVLNTHIHTHTMRNELPYWFSNHFFLVSVCVSPFEHVYVSTCSLKVENAIDLCLLRSQYLYGSSMRGKQNRFEFIYMYIRHIVSYQKCHIWENNFFIYKYIEYIYIFMAQNKEKRDAFFVVVVVFVLFILALCVCVCLYRYINNIA